MCEIYFFILLTQKNKKFRAHNQRWGIRDGYVYALADPRIVLAAQVKLIHYTVRLIPY